MTLCHGGQVLLSCSSWCSSEHESHVQHCALKPTLESSQCSLWARRYGIQEAIWLYYFTYSSITKSAVLVSRGAVVLEEGIVPLSQGYFAELCRNCYQLPLGADCSLYNFTSTCVSSWGSDLLKERKKTHTLRGKCFCLCRCSSVTIQETFGTFPNPLTNPRLGVCKQHSGTDKVLRREQQFYWPLHVCL